MNSLFVLAFLLGISTGYGLKCYECFSTKGWDDCDKVEKEVTCELPSQDRCGRTFLSYYLPHYAKGCAVSTACSKVSDLCQSVDPSVDCEVNCCCGNFCNGATVPVVSAIMLLACALVAFLH